MILNPSGQILSGVSHLTLAIAIWYRYGETSKLLWATIVLPPWWRNSPSHLCRKHRQQADVKLSWNFRCVLSVSCQLWWKGEEKCFTLLVPCSSHFLVGVFHKCVLQYNNCWHFLRIFSWWSQVWLQMSWIQVFQFKVEYTIWLPVLITARPGQEPYWGQIFKSLQLPREKICADNLFCLSKHLSCTNEQGGQQWLAAFGSKQFQLYLCHKCLVKCQRRPDSGLASAMDKSLEMKRDVLNLEMWHQCPVTHTRLTPREHVGFRWVISNVGLWRPHSPFRSNCTVAATMQTTIIASVNFPILLVIQEESSKPEVEITSQFQQVWIVFFWITKSLTCCCSPWFCWTRADAQIIELEKESACLCCTAYCSGTPASGTNPQDVLPKVSLSLPGSFIKFCQSSGLVLCSVESVELHAKSMDKTWWGLHTALPPKF